MTNSEQKQKLYEQLDIWDESLKKLKKDNNPYSPMTNAEENRIYGVILGMISMSLGMQIIDIEESEELGVKYGLI
jgi:hypothetical protein